MILSTPDCELRTGGGQKWWYIFFPGENDGKFQRLGWNNVKIDYQDTFLNI